MQIGRMTLDIMPSHKVEKHHRLFNAANVAANWLF